MGSRLTVPLAESRGRQGAWLLELVIDGSPRYYTSSPVAVDVDGIRYRPGIAPFTRSLGRANDQQGLQVDDLVTDWTAIEAAGGSIEWSTGRLWWWYPGQTLDRALWVMSGRVVDHEIADPEARTALVFTLDSAARAPRLYPDAQAVIDETTWTDDLLVDEIGAPARGATYLTVLGYPGSGDDDNGLSVPRPAVPVPMVHFNQLSGPGQSQLMLGFGEVDAAQVEVHDPDEGEDFVPHDTMAAENVDDLLGRRTRVAIFRTPLQTPTVFPWSAHSYFAGFLNAPDWGGGLVWNGRVLRGLGDVLSWALRMADVDADVDRQDGEADRLNDLFKLDTYINTPTDLVRWIETSLREMFPLRRLRLGTGLWYRLENWLATPEDAVARLDADTGQIQQASPRRRLRGPLYNQFTVEYQRDAISGAFRLRKVLSAEQRDGWLAAITDTRIQSSPICRESQARYGVRERAPFQATHLWSSSTVSAVLEHWAARDALGLDGITYEGPQLDRLLPGDVVVVNDTRARLTERLAIVDDVIVGGPTVQADFWLLPLVRRS